MISPIKTAAVANAVLAVLETKHQKARDWYAKLTDEQKTQRNAKRRDAYAMKKVLAVRQRCVRSLRMLVIIMLKINLYTHNFFTQFTVLAVLETKFTEMRTLVVDAGILNIIILLYKFG